MKTQKKYISAGRSVFRQAAGAVAMLSVSASLAFAAPVFDQSVLNFQGQVFSQGALPGAEAEVRGRAFIPGQKVTLSRGGVVLNDGQPFAVDEKGEFSGKIAVPADSVPGVHPVVVQASGPSAAVILDLKISPNVPLSGEDKYTLTSKRLVQGLYQVAYSSKNDRLFVTTAIGRPPVKESSLLKVNPATLEVEASAEMALAKSRDDGHRLAVYGIGLDDANGNVWTTNTRDGAVAVYKQSDLSLVKQFDSGLVDHARDVAVDASTGKAYASMPMENKVAVFDIAKLEHLKDVEIDSLKRGAKFGTYSLALDSKGGKLYTVSGSTNEAAVIDTKTDTVEKVFAIDGVRGAIGVAVDPASKRLFVAAQGSDNLAIVDLENGKTLHNVAVGAGALNVAFDTVTGHAYVTNRGAGTVTVVDVDGKIVANLPGGTFPNHATPDGKGAVYVVNKSRGKDDPQGDRITRIEVRK
ncbi:YncE family protein [Paracandidimonas soli]|uniref:YncE family protein n=1 Tax=Paracandidimonas soli TaxID=1917182 RepID=UPI00334029D0